MKIYEMPEGIKFTDLSNSVKQDIEQRPEFTNGGIIELGDGLRKIEGMEVVYYWYENDKGEMLLAVSLEKVKYGVQITSIGKFTKKSKPFASDLYLAILHDRKNITGNVGQINLLSDKQLSQEGLSIWKRLLTDGHTIFVFDNSQKQASPNFIEITTVNEMVKFFKEQDRDFRKWQYVIQS